MFTGGLLMGSGMIALSFLPPWQVQFALVALLGCAFYFLHGVIQIFVTELAPSVRSSAAVRGAWHILAGRLPASASVSIYSSAGVRGDLGAPHPRGKAPTTSKGYPLTHENQQFRAPTKWVAARPPQNVIM
jgi:hypothetical protein